jgi:hypothetical protein
VTVSEELREAAKSLMRVADAIDHPDPRDGLTLVERIREGFQGWPSGSGFDGTGRGTRMEQHDVMVPLRTQPGRRVPVPFDAAAPRNDPTGEAATRPDHAKADLDRLHKDTRAVTRTARSLLDVWARHTLRAPNPVEQLEGAPEPGCQSCARVSSPGTVGLAKTHQTAWWNPVDRNVLLADGRKVGLCSWCRKDAGPYSAAQTGDMPPLQAVEAHRDGRRLGRTA